MRLPLWLLTTVVALACAAPAGAVLDGKPDTAHPYVGILVTEIGNDRVPVCSGFLVSPRAFVTAAHCIADLGSLPALVSFDKSFTPSSIVSEGRKIPNPEFGAPEADTHDIALVRLLEPVGGPYAQLPDPGLLRSVRKKAPLTIVGYGATGFSRGGGPPAPEFELVRTARDARLSKLQKGGFNLRVTNGICFGDSGGPVLLRSTDTVVGINSFVNNDRCAGHGFAYRVDTAESLRFLAPHL